MKIRFSIRHLLVGVFLVAAVLSLSSLYSRWRQDYLDREYREYQTLESLSSLSNGTSLSDAELLFGELMFFDPGLASILIPDDEMTEKDKIYAVVINASNARFLHFRDDVLVNHEFTSQEMQDWISSAQLPIPKWYIQFGQWLVCLAFLAVFGLFACLWGAFRKRRIEKAASPSIEGTVEG